MKILLIGNGASALAKELGSQIDAFDGKVARFNGYSTKRYEKWVGTRTDIWFTTTLYKSETDINQLRTCPETYYVTQRFDEPTEKSMARIGANRFPVENFKKTMDKTGIFPSSGLLATEFFLEQKHEVYLWGFDFMMLAQHHYNNDKEPRGENHNPGREWLYFQSLIKEGNVRYFGWDKEKESTPIIRTPTPCGTDKDVMWYREPAHNAWYKWFGTMLKNKTVLDVGCGCGAGAKVLLEQGVKSVVGVDIDERLRGKFPEIIIGSLDQFKDNSFDAITCVDVIEHVVEDKVLMKNMRRIAKELYLTTPNFSRSRCGNVAHAREYTMAQFMNLFRPKEIWSASPDGSIHLTKVLERAGNYVIDHSPEREDNKVNINALMAYKEVPLHTRFNYTADGNEWAHICAIWN
jgi:2-polyprenyl-3-methyl-5-hydroxy-6-metoxy-1,4-benzoquinol methylase